MPSKKFLIFFIFFIVCSVAFSQEKKITEVTIVGAKKIDTIFFKKLLETKKGVFLDSLSIKNDIQFLKRLPAVHYATFKIKQKALQEYKVEFTVAENFTIIPEVNFWTTTHKRFAYKLGLYDYNFLGKNITFGGFYQNNGFNSYGVNFRAPNLFSKQWGLSINHQNWKSEEPLYFGNQSANYLYNNISFEVLALYQINLKHQFNFGLNLFNEKYQYLSGFFDASKEQLNVNKALFKFVYSYNTLNYFYQYVKGFKSNLYVQYVASQNNFQNNFFIFWNDFFYYKRVGVKGNWANRLRFGLSSNEKTPFAPFALDNNVNLRGVGILVDRGTGSFVLNSEYRHTVYDKKGFAIQTNIFSDFGSWRNPGGELNDFFERKNLRLYSGIGLRFISKKIYNAVFRIDYGFRITNNKNNSKGGVVFGIGQYF